MCAGLLSAIAMYHAAAGAPEPGTVYDRTMHVCTSHASRIRVGVTAVKQVG